MKIISILVQSPPFPHTGGAEIQMHSLHKGLLAAGVDLHVIADILLVKKTFQYFEGVPVWGVHLPHVGKYVSKLSPAIMWLAYSLIKRKIFRPDLIHVTMFRESAVMGSYLASKFDVPWTVRLACSGAFGDLRYARSHALMADRLDAMTRSVQRVITIDNQTEKEAIEAGVRADKILQITNAVTLKKIPLMDWTAGISNPNILYVGRLASQKRVETFVDACQEIATEQPKFTFTIVGEGPLRETLQIHATRLGMRDKINFVGRVDNPEDYLVKASCFVSASESEGMPNSVLEAMACGLPVILSDIPVHRDLATRVGMSEFLFPVGDSAMLSSRIRQFMALENAKKIEFGQRCASYASRHSPDVRNAAYLKMFEQAIAEFKTAK